MILVGDGNHDVEYATNAREFDDAIFTPQCNIPRRENTPHGCSPPSETGDGAENVECEHGTFFCHLERTGCYVTPQPEKNGVMS